MPLIAAEGATVQPTTISGLYTVEGPTANIGQLATELAANPAVEYAQPVQTVRTSRCPTTRTIPTATSGS